MQEHYNSEKHQKSLVRCAQQIILRKNDDSTEADTDMGGGPTSLLDNHYDRLSVIARDTAINHDELGRLDDRVFRFNNQMSNFSEQLNNTQTELSLEKSQLEATSMNQNILKQDITTLKQQIDNDNEIIKQEPDGTNRQVSIHLLSIHLLVDIKYVFDCI